ncbi:hypothetical protein [Endozoicomonas sp. ALB115]|uniref:hypothetical protein n=1 Tax=Endozoicomonas sp. ALB115 TaxID=3403074 RepID=UPI003BB566E4
MATFVDIVQADGSIKIKAVCRIWKEGKQVSKSKTFKTRPEAEAWAGKIELLMKRENTKRTLHGIVQRLDQRFESYDDECSLRTIGEFVGVFKTALDHFKPLEDTTFLMLRSDTIEAFFEKRVEEGASSKELLFEAELLFSIFRYRDGKDNKRSANLVQMAITALRTRGIME